MSRARPGTPVPHHWGTAPGFVGPRHALRERLLLELLLSGRPGPEVLNAGAGQGTFSHSLESRGFSVTSSDASAEACEVLERSVLGEVVRAALPELPFADECFDAVVAGEVLEHLEDDGGAVRELARVLRRGGVLVASVPANPAWFGPSDTWAGHVRRYTRERLLEAFSGSGLEVEICRAWGFPVSSAYHRIAYDSRAERLAGATAAPSLRRRLALAALSAALQLDRVFVGRERGALGYLVRARRSA